MKVYKNPAPSEWKKILSRPALDSKKVEKVVKPILKKVKRKGDRALVKFALEYDHVELQKFEVDKKDIEAAEDQMDAALKHAIKVAINNVRKFHEAQKTGPLEMETMPGIFCSRKNLPIQKVGLYIPGGTAPLFSTVIMLGVPAVIAGCKEIILCTPPNPSGKINPAILYTANLIGIQRIFMVGGAQAIAAMAYGTESIPQVYKIFGPGNQYVTTAKQLVSKEGVAIDMPAGPSEVLVYADETAVPSFVAADLLSQAEHGVDSQVVLVSLNEELVKEVKKEIEVQLLRLPRKDIAQKSLSGSMAIIMKDNEQAIELINEYAAEHLILAVNDPEGVAGKIYHAGSVFLGNYSPESAGDYATGTNHTLPTNGYAKAYSGVSLESFYKTITYQKLSPEGLQTIGHTVELMAEAEQLIAHKEAISIRLKYLNNNV
ncbi:MAG: histidinol dehydrogenase [Bacteroidota bacterium]|nr:histidinol dehydrogenase [Bacteroidota bacterium]